VVGVAGITAGMLSGRSWALNLTARQWRLLGIFAVSVVAISWALKVFVLGN
jgi:hypothetical protein